MATPAFVFLDGKILPYNEAKVGVMTHGLNYGTGVFGGVRGYWNEKKKQLYIFRPHDHYKRFIDSGKLLRMELPFTKEQLTQATIDLIKKLGYKETVYIRPLAFYGDELIGVRLHNLTPKVSIAIVPFGKYIESPGAHVTISSWRRIDDNIIPARGKVAGAYVNSALAKTDAQLAGFDEAIVLDQSGHVSEGSAENLFMIRNGVFVTPPITENILEGITRRTVLEFIQKDLKMPVQERSIDRTELFLADELFFAGSGVQIVPITKVDNRKIGSGEIGPYAKKIVELYMNTVHGNVRKYRDWCVPVY
ncbi:MAG TPA: branched-chain amino acid transaminase [Bacteroidota bacterium]|nr:branched-chain amino acid transaminase [Bacteroidota bacterium]